MMERTLEALLNSFKSQWAQESRWLGVLVKLPNVEQPEVIINPKENFEAKAAYYESAYDENLVMKNNSEIQILAWTFGNSFDDVQTELGLGRTLEEVEAELERAMLGSNVERMKENEEKANAIFAIAKTLMGASPDDQVEIGIIREMLPVWGLFYMEPSDQIYLITYRDGMQFAEDQVEFHVLDEANSTDEIAVYEYVGEQADLIRTAIKAELAERREAEKSLPVDTEQPVDDVAKAAFQVIEGGKTE